MKLPSSVRSPERIRRVLRRTFGLSRLRDGQEPVIARLLAGLSTLAVMPTGAGKSLCYQLPAVLFEGRTIVVSPLIALMKDQCESLDEKGIAAVQLHSALNAAELAASTQAIEDGSAKVVFTTPEQLTNVELIETLKRGGVSLLVVDEAHCLSQWGFDFRPAFLEIGHAIEALGRPPVLALTATATDAVVDDITTQLSIPRAGVIGTHLFRPNLHYRAEHFSRAEDKLSRLIALVGESSGSGLVYVATIKAAEELHAALEAAGQTTGLYHGRLSAAKRHAAQDAFMSGATRVMVATNAFGLGIDKPDIRFVIHHQIPTGLDAYCQESGRAGRDGEPAVCTLLFIDGDRNVQQFFLSGRYPQLEDFRALVDALLRIQSRGGSCEIDEVTAAAGNGKKAIVALNMLRQRDIVQIRDDGFLVLDDAAFQTEGLESLVEISKNKSLRDRAMLEAMVAYAQSGRCRWRLLLDHFEDASPADGCGTCDNCQRLGALRAEQAKAPAADDQIVVAQAKTFAIGERVRTRRHGQAKVVETDALSVTVEFDNGQQRCFKPEFLTSATRRTQPSIAAQGSNLGGYSGGQASAAADAVARNAGLAKR